MKKFFLFVTLLYSSWSYGTNYYMSANGDDTKDGKSINTAWKSIERLNQNIKNLQPGDSVLFRRGDTFRGSVNSSASGVSGNYVVWAAYGSGPKPIISGAIVLSQPTNEGNNVYAYSASQKITHLFINGKQMTIARYPNKGYLTIESATNGTITSSKLALSSGTWLDATVHYRKQNDRIARGTVSSFSGNTIVTDLQEVRKDHGLYLDGVAAALDSASEWYQDPQTNKVYVKFPANQTPETSTVEGSVFDIGFECNYGPRYIHFHNLDIRYYTNMGIHFSATEDDLIQNCDFHYMNLRGLKIQASPTENSKNVTINKCNFYDNNNFSIEIAQAENMYITNNFIKRNSLVAGYEDPVINGGQAMFVNFSGGTISYNTLDSIGYTGISWGGKNIMIERNIVSNTGLTKNDNGFMQTWGGETANNTIKENICYNGFGNSEGLPGGNGLSFARASAEGIYFDDFTHDNKIIGNTVWNSKNGIFIQSSRNFEVRENTVYNCYDNQFYINEKNPNEDYAEKPLGWSRSVSDIKVYKNVFYALSSKQNGVRISSDDCNSLFNLGVFDSNYVFNPYSKETFIKSVQPCIGNRVDSTFNLRRWQASTAQDIHSKTNVFLWSEQVAQTVGNNKIANPNFKSGISDWGIYQSGVKVSWDNNSPLDTGALKFENISENNGEVYTNLFTLTKDKVYIFKFSIIGTADAAFKIELVKQTPFNFLHQRKSFVAEKNRNDYEFIFTSPSDETTGKLSFYTEKGTVFWLDNASLYEVSSFENDKIFENSKLFVNDTKAEKTFDLAGKIYTNLDGKTVCGSIKIAPYRSQVLLLTPTAECSLLNTFAATGNETGESSLNIFPNPSEGNLSIINLNSETSALEVSDIHGRIVLHQKVSETNLVQLDLSNQPKGMYFIKPIGGYQKTTKILIK